MSSHDRAVYKYKLNAVAETMLNLPRGAVLLHVGAQPCGVMEDLCLWALVNVESDAPVESWRFTPVMTGQMRQVLSNNDYVGTVLLMGGSYVVHVFAENLTQ